jgi:hypothetical protein
VAYTVVSRGVPGATGAAGAAGATGAAGSAGPSGSSDTGWTRFQYTISGSALTGLTNYSSLWEDWEALATPASWNNQASGGATAAASTANYTCARYNTGSPDGNVLQSETATLGQRFAGTANSDKWYLAFRSCVITTGSMGQTSEFLAGLCNSARNSSITCGAYGTGSNYVLQYDGNFGPGHLASLGTLVDNAFHVFEMWHPGDGTLHARVDGGTPVVVTPASPPTSCYRVVYTLNNVAGKQHIQDVDWMLALAQRS